MESLRTGIPGYGFDPMTMPLDERRTKGALLKNGAREAGLRFLALIPTSSAPVPVRIGPLTDKMTKLTSRGGGQTQRVSILLLGALCVALVILLLLKWDCPPNSIPAYEFEQYVLYTWNVRSGEFCFALMIQADRYQFRRRWFPKRHAKCGLADLKLAIAAVPRDKLILWQNSPSEGFDYPDENVIREMIEFAKDRGIKLERDRALQ